MAGIFPPNNFIENSGIGVPSNPLSNIKKPNIELPNIELPDFKKSFNTTSNINDAQQTKLTAYWKKGTEGYPIFYSEAKKSYANGEDLTLFISQEIPTYIEQTNEQVKQIVSRTFWDLSQQIYNSDVFNGILPPSEDSNQNPLPVASITQYNVADFILDPPKNVPWQQPIPSPEEKEKERFSLKAKREKLQKEAQDNIPDTEEIKNAIPKDLLAKGKEALPGIVYTLGYTILQEQVIPSLQKLVIEYLEKYLKDGIQSCPPELQILIDTRNKIVIQLNKLAKKIEQIGTSISGISLFITTIITTITTIDTAQIILSAATKIIPPGIPIPGQVTSALNDAQTFIRKITFDKLGNSKIAATTAVVASSGLVLSLIGGWILQAIEILNRLDVLILNCDPNSTLVPLSDDVKSISSLNLQAMQTQNKSTYKGFILDIETIPYTPTVNRYQAIGKNSQGIILIKSELSFTSNNQTLINELKLIIDRDNLTGY
jgi:hypothetical protein